ncbi:27623_t:CDS:2 [Gigaspora margarita]|uniref:27623_t:CDS:1 n=1 Tax=Gigaspora margarita TaxID=4874 RepID=A0ABM8W780_GIGMA|nr:27623_t:CDS:2 [Gigaspora margarita]
MSYFTFTGGQVTSANLISGSAGQLLIKLELITMRLQKENVIPVYEILICLK